MGEGEGEREERRQQDGPPVREASSRMSVDAEDVGSFVSGVVNSALRNVGSSMINQAQPPSSPSSRFALVRRLANADDSVEGSIHNGGEGDVGGDAGFDDVEEKFVGLLEKIGEKGVFCVFVDNDG